MIIKLKRNEKNTIKIKIKDILKEEDKVNILYDYYHQSKRGTMEDLAIDDNTYVFGVFKKGDNLTLFDFGIKTGEAASDGSEMIFVIDDYNIKNLPYDTYKATLFFFPEEAPCFNLDVDIIIDSTLPNIKKEEIPSGNNPEDTPSIQEGYSRFVFTNKGYTLYRIVLTGKETKIFEVPQQQTKTFDIPIGTYSYSISSKTRPYSWWTESGSITFTNKETKTMSLGLDPNPPHIKQIGDGSLNGNIDITNHTTKNATVIISQNNTEVANETITPNGGYKVLNKNPGTYSYVIKISGRTDQTGTFTLTNSLNGFAEIHIEKTDEDYN